MTIRGGASLLISSTGDQETAARAGLLPRTAGKCRRGPAAMGAPGIPSAGMVTMVMVLQSVGLPAEAIAILLPIDRLLDTLRTSVNVEGDMVGSLIVQKFTQAH